MANNETNDLRLAQVFATKAFRIPDHQRGYAWGVRQWNDLWEDIWDINEDTSTGDYQPHFTGTICLKEISRHIIPEEERWFKDKGNSFYAVVDGQQRLTTLEIMIFELIKSYPDEEEKLELQNTFLFKSRNSTNTRLYLFSYGKKDKNRAFLLNRIFEDTTVVLPTEFVNVYTNNLKKAKEWFCEKINMLSDEQKIDLLHRIQTALVFDIKYISNSVSEQAVFETMNNRGKPLSILEKLKNRLLFLTAKLSCQFEDKIILSGYINEAWRKVYDYLGKNPEGMLDEDDFLSAHLTLIRKPKETSFSIQAAEEKVFQMFCNRTQNYTLDYGAEDSAGREPVVDYKKIEDYVLDIAEFVPYWYEVYNSLDERIRKIRILNDSKEMRILLATLLMLKNDSRELADKSIDLLLKIAFRNSLPSMNVVDERTYAQRARELHNKELNLDELNDKLEGFINTDCNAEGMIGQFNWLFEYERGAKGFHRWNGLKFFLMEYEQHLQGNDLPHVSWDNYYDISIEHILPQAYQTNWSKVMDEYLKGKELSDDENWRAQKIIINTLGNLTIIKGAKNSELQNGSWNAKRERYKNGTFCEIKIAQNSEWNGNTILNRGIEMLSFLMTMVTGLSLTEEQQKRMLFVAEKYFPAISE
ncbi:MAG: DUF262 domain-containing protein [Bacteroidales bacterium]|nr:DUF262 domain-containing protein [Bacteroidales bacterium]